MTREMRYAGGKIKADGKMVGDYGAFLVVTFRPSGTEEVTMGFNEHEVTALIRLLGDELEAAKAP